MHKYEMHRAGFEEDTEQTKFGPQMDERMDELTDKVKTLYSPSTLFEAEGVMMTQFTDTYIGLHLLGSMCSVSCVH